MGYKSFEYKINDDYIGFYEAYFNISTDSEDFYSYLTNHDVKSEDIDKLKKQIQEISILMNLGVAKAHKQQGYGSKLMELVLMECRSDCLLICSVTDKNEFSLQSWYEKKGFETIAWAKANPVMLKKK